MNKLKFSKVLCSILMATWIIIGFIIIIMGSTERAELYIRLATPITSMLTIYASAIFGGNFIKQKFPILESPNNQEPERSN